MARMVHPVIGLGHVSDLRGPMGPPNVHRMRFSQRGGAPHFLDSVDREIVWSAPGLQARHRAGKWHNESN